MTKAKAWAARRQLLKQQYQGRKCQDKKVVQEEAEAEAGSTQQGECATVLQSMLKKEKDNLIETKLKIEMIENELKKLQNN